MRRMLALVACGYLLSNAAAYAACTYPYTLTNGATANATEVMANFNAVPSCVSGFAPTVNPVFTGNVGVGTAASAILELYASQPQPVITSTYTTTTTNNWYSMLRFRSPFGSGNTTISNDDAQIRIVRGNHSYNGDGWTHDADMTFWVNASNRDYAPQEGMRLTSEGNLGIGTTSPSYRLHVNGTAYATGAAGALSDKRHKEHIRPLGLNGTQVVSRLKPVSFHWKQPLDSGMRGPQMGFVAQDVQKVLPGAVLVSDDKERALGLKYNELIAVLTKAVQEQQGSIDDLRKEVVRQRDANEAAQKQLTALRIRFDADIARHVLRRTALAN